MGTDIDMMFEYVNLIPTKKEGKKITDDFIWLYVIFFPLKKVKENKQTMLWDVNNTVLSVTIVKNLYAALKISGSITGLQQANCSVVVFNQNTLDLNTER